MDIDWREHRRWVRVEDRWANVVELGSGPPVLMIHGLSGSWQNWLENIPVLAERHRVVAMDLPGFGESEMPRDKITISGYGRWICSLCEELGIERAAFVGNSMGGFVSAETAITFPQMVEKLVLVSSAGITSEHQRNEQAMAALYAAEGVLAWYTAWVAKKADSWASRTRLKRLALAAVLRHPHELPAPLLSEQIRGSGKRGFMPALDALTSYPIRDRLPDIAVPTLIVWGTHDRLVPLKDASEFERLIPGSRKVIFNDTGHMPMLERPGRFNRLLEDFLAERPSPAEGPVDQAEAEAVREAEAEAAATGD